MERKRLVLTLAAIATQMQRERIKGTLPLRPIPDYWLLVMEYSI